MNIKAIFDAIIRKLNFGIKREMARKGAEATNVLRNVEIEVLSKPGSGKKYKALPNRSSSPEKHQHHSLEDYVRNGKMKQ